MQALSGMAPTPSGSPNESVRTTLTILEVGCFEPLKAAVHGAALGLVVLMGAYNVAAWLRRRQRHLAVNAIIYGVAAVWESRHVTHHLNGCKATLLISGDSIVDGPGSEGRHAA